jgi:hypothetical protein
MRYILVFGEKTAGRAIIHRLDCSQLGPLQYEKSAQSRAGFEDGFEAVAHARKDGGSFEFCGHCLNESQWIKLVLDKMPGSFT